MGGKNKRIKAKYLKSLFCQAIEKCYAVKAYGNHIMFFCSLVGWGIFPL